MARLGISVDQGTLPSYSAQLGAPQAGLRNPRKGTALCPERTKEAQSPSVLGNLEPTPSRPVVTPK